MILGSQAGKTSNRETTAPSTATFWRVEGSLLNLSAVRPVAFFTWNAQSFAERWARRSGLALLALVRPFFYATNRVFATRLLHTLLRGVSRDRLDLLGEEYFQYVLKPQLKRKGVEKLQHVLSEGSSVILVSQALDHVMRPLAKHLGVECLVANRLEFRDRVATGRLLDPVIRPRGGLARFTGGKADGRLPLEQLSRDLGFSDRSKTLSAAIVPVDRPFQPVRRHLVRFDKHKEIKPLSVRESLAGRHILLIGATGFIGKVWLATALTKLPEIGKIYLLVRRQRSTTAQRRFEKMVEESPLFEGLYEQHGAALPQFLDARLEVIEGDVAQPGLGIDPEIAQRIAARLDVIINSSGLTDFNPDLRAALAANVDATVHILDFQRRCSHAGLLHLSTCYVVGARDGRVPEEMEENYTPTPQPDFDAEREWKSLHSLVREIDARSEIPEVTAELRRQAMDKSAGDQSLSDAALENQIRKNRVRWIRNQLVDAGMQRAQEFGWPNTYTFTKSLSESLIAAQGSDLPFSIVRPSIVESSTHEPFAGWNEGVNTSAPISYLLGTYFRQLPTNERKCLDLIPVDTVCRGMILIAAAIVQRCHAKVYQLATSGINPCDMGRSIELTSLAHRKHYRAQEGLESWLRARFDTIPVSKERYKKLSAPRQKIIIRALQRLGTPLSMLVRALARKERGLERVEKLIELYEPFILHNEQVFDAEQVEMLSEALPPEERMAFGYDIHSIDWWDYWINVHVPALRKWSYPLIEGRQLEPRPTRPFRLEDAKVAASPTPASQPVVSNHAEAR